MSNKKSDGREPMSKAGLLRAIVPIESIALFPLHLKFIHHHKSPD